MLLLLLIHSLEPRQYVALVALVAAVIAGFAVVLAVLSWWV
jgi:hypothetical protein